MYNFRSSSQIQRLNVADHLSTVRAAPLFPKSANTSADVTPGHTLHALRQATELWEEASKAILQRERILEELENFERAASAPDRLYAKVSESSRTAEAKMRASIMARLRHISKRVHKAIDKIEQTLQDTVTFNQRLYRYAIDHCKPSARLFIMS